MDNEDFKMKKRYSEEQIIKAIKQHEAGAKVDKLLEVEAMKDVVSKKW